VGSGNHSSRTYVPALDGIRAVAILFVFLYHAGYLPGGWVGVDIFFTLSGYLITTILVTEFEARGSVFIRRFFFRRACRLLPAVVVLVGVALALSFYFNDQLRETKIDAVAALLYVEDFRYAFSPVTGTTLGHLWSLSVEEQFYLIWPFFLIVSLSLFGQERSFYVVIVTIVFVILWRFALLTEHSASPYYRIYFSFDTRIDELLIGSALALWGRRPGQALLRTIKLSWPFIFIFFIAILIKVDPVTKWEGVSSYPLIGAATACLIVILTTEEIPFLTRLFTLAPLVALGRISYGFYLWHYLIIHEVKTGGFTILYVTVLSFALTLIVSIGSYRLIEQPVLRLGRRAY
jgi:peptidoglycan/LPS O-acetylase OafA/YrhL